MKSFIAFMLILGFMACGETKPGPSGPPGNDGVSPPPADPLPPAPPHDPIPGQDGESAIAWTITCALDWQHEAAGRGHKLDFLVIEFTNGIRFATFTSMFYSQDGQKRDSYTQAFPKGSPDFDSATITAPIFKAELLPGNKAKFTFQPSNVERITECVKS